MPMLPVIQNANLALRFLLELCALVAPGYWGFQTGQGLLSKIGLGIGVPLLTVVIWVMFIALTLSCIYLSQYLLCLGSSSWG